MLFSVCFADENPVLNNEDDKISYSVGYQMGSDFKRQNLNIKPEAFLKGIQDALAGSKPLIDRQEMRKTLAELKRKVVAAQRAKQSKVAEKNLVEGKEFLAENKQKEGVKTLPSGLQYKVIKEGTGGRPKETDTVKVHYRGTLIDGTEFDSSYSRGKPATFRADRVIAGWTEALQMMKEGKDRSQ
jgi:FKBP-type peptidyl-prolyl cis-trans isomerase FklB